jgi:hypothetical protein
VPLADLFSPLHPTLFATSIAFSALMGLLLDLARLDEAMLRLYQRPAVLLPSPSLRGSEPVIFGCSSA